MLINQPSDCKLAGANMKVKHCLTILLSKIVRVLLTTAFPTSMLETQSYLNVEFKGTSSVTRTLLQACSIGGLLYDCETLILLFFVIYTLNWSIL